MKRWLVIASLATTLMMASQADAQMFGRGRVVRQAWRQATPVYRNSQYSYASPYYANPNQGGYYAPRAWSQPGWNSGAYYGNTWVQPRYVPSPYVQPGYGGYYNAYPNTPMGRVAQAAGVVNSIVNGTPAPGYGYSSYVIPYGP